MRQLKRILWLFLIGFFYAGVAFAGDGDGGSWISGVLGAAASGIGGGLLGGVLGIGKKWITNRHEAKMQEQRDAREDKDRAHELLLADKEIERDMQAADNKLDQAKFEADSTALVTASASQDKEITALESTLEGSWGLTKNFAAFLFALVTFTQKMIRPGLTLALVYETFDMFNRLDDAMGGLRMLPITDQTELFKRIVFSILGLTGMAVGFWFVARPEKQNRV